jgi:hypothetical protein
MVIARVTKSMEMSSGIDRLWDLFSRVEEDERYWGAIKDAKILKREGNTIEREAYVGVRNHKSRQRLVLDPNRSILLTLVGEGISGDRLITLVPIGKNRTRVDVTWNMEVLDVPGFVTALVERQLARVTEEALEKFRREAEATHSSIATGSGGHA